MHLMNKLGSSNLHTLLVKCLLRKDFVNTLFTLFCLRMNGQICNRVNMFEVIISLYSVLLYLVS